MLTLGTFIIITSTENMVLCPEIGKGGKEAERV